ncbi:MAG: DUF2511 domain-containing protein [Planctomycetota bacterium]|jgi:hypothetical protein
MKKLFIDIMVLALCSSFIIGCGETQKEEAKFETSKPGIKVTAAEYVNKWPFQDIREGYVICDGTAAIFEANGKKYALNGVAKSRFNYPFPYEAGIIKKIPLNPSNPSLGTINADTEILRKLCD